MKPPIPPISHHLFKPTSSNYFLCNTRSPSSLHTLASHFLSSDLTSTQSVPKPQLNPNQNPQNKEPINTQLPNSSKQSKPINETTFGDLVSYPKPQINDYGNTHLHDSLNLPKPTIRRFKTNFKGYVFWSNETINTPLGDSFTKSKRIIKTLEPILPKFTWNRPFSATKLLSFVERNSSPSNPIPVVSTVSSPSESSPPIDAGSSIRKPISLWPGMYHSPVTNALWEARSSIFERLSNAPSEAPLPNELITKTPSQSRTSVHYKFSSDYILREQYRNPWNGVRMGKLLEDLDALAGTISFKHCSNEDSTRRPLLLVTASVDKIVLKKPIHVDTDLKIVGAVTWVGRSSMEIRLEVIRSTEEISNPSDSVALTANFTFVARDSETGKSALVNQISPESEQEKLLWQEAEERNKMRKKNRGEHKKVIEDWEVDRLNELLAEGRVFCHMPALADRDSILMRDTCHQNSLICQPQQRNIHGRIFGGFLMRRAFELAFATTYAFVGSVPCFLEVDRVDFLKPVDVGNFLLLKSCVLFTELENPDQPLINVEVVAHVTRPELRSSEVSNKFYFTFTVRSEAKKSDMRIRNVVPATEEEARRVIERMEAEKLEKLNHG
ncbi:acyl-coenzyme A thioesterase 2, chloroplastic-like [Cornus florida]|uniref:acyl-coenzyme A thioesterase 2, chloroplastic-like n=1 Tax=Cornus florida TaxID=4283 RepID=UPI002899B7B0|nr:acyl-coenzyme A thioesterase 2, chloroplastic-like [Cornus florida]